MEKPVLTLANGFEVKSFVDLKKICKDLNKHYELEGEDRITIKKVNDIQWEIETPDLKERVSILADGFKIYQAFESWLEEMEKYQEDIESA